MERRVVVTDVHDRAGLAACRALRSAGYVVTGIASARPAAGHWSFSCSERFTLVDPRRDPDGYVAGLESIVSRGGYQVAVLGNDASLLAVSPRRAALEAHVRLGLPPDEVVRGAVDKRTLVGAAREAGLASPETIVCSSSEEGAEAARRLGFPVILKPRRSVFSVAGELRERGSRRVADPAALERLIPKHGTPFLVQKALEGEVHSVAGVVAAGRLIAVAVSRYRRTWPVESGSAAFSETVEPPGGLVEKVEALLLRLGWQGIFELELIARPDGSFAAIDLNPRLYGSISLAVAAGAPLPAIWCDWLLGRDPPPVTARAGMRYRWEDADLRHGLWQIRRGHVMAGLRVLRPHRRVVHAYFALGDPGPLAARLLFMAGTRSARRAPPRPVEAGAAAPGRRVRQRAPTVAVIGAGPHGLATAAYLRRAGVETTVFGRPLEFWRRQMPRGMLLRSRKRSSSIADPDRALGLDAWAAAEGRTLGNPLALGDFIDYGDWFQRRAVPEVDPRLVRRVERNGRGFALTLDDGETVEAERVVVAAGLYPFANRPAPFEALPGSLVSHSSDHVSFDAFAGLSLVVVGGGQSALESAALLHEAGARVEVVIRASAACWLNDVSIPRPPTLRERMLPPTDVGGRVTGWIAAAPDAYRIVPGGLKGPLSLRCTKPAGAGWLRPRLAGVPLATCAVVVTAEAAGGGVRLVLDDGSTRSVDHVLLGTGYRVDVRRYPFLGGELLGELAVRDGYPVLGLGLESSVRGLHFVGAPAAYSFGPVMRFVVGSWYAAPAVCGRVLGRRQPPLRFSF